eukprot:m.146248 g.146248  ORF g.146248 m.146248 type:complete len:117 (-) comp20526_c0_seq3:125-475(-)
MRARVLQMYARIMRLSGKWQAVDSANTAQERAFIRQEARTLFKANKNVVADAEIEALLGEAEERIALAAHYRIPYPRLPNVGYGAAPQQQHQLQKRQEKLRQASIPSYVRSAFKPR